MKMVPAVLLFVLLPLAMMETISDKAKCEAAVPSMKDECLALSGTTFHCCYSMTNFSQASRCTSVDKETKNIQLINNFGTYETYLDCGHAITGQRTSSFAGQTTTENKNKLLLPNKQCGNSNPNKLDDCTHDSLFMNSCCMFTQSNTMNTGCYRIGTSFKGDVNIGNYKVSCLGTFVKIEVLLGLLFLFIFI